jgi:hypothetical protein
MVRCASHRTGEEQEDEMKLVAAFVLVCSLAPVFAQAPENRVLWLKTKNREYVVQKYSTEAKCMEARDSYQAQSDKNTPKRGYVWSCRPVKGSK